MRTRKMRLMSFVLALAMMLAVAPVSAFAVEIPKDAVYIDSDSVKFDADGKLIIPDGTPYNENNSMKTYCYPAKDNQQWVKPENGALYTRPGTVLVPSNSTVVKEAMQVSGFLSGGIYTNSVAAYQYVATKGAGVICDGVFQSTVTLTNGGEIAGGLFLGTVSNTSGKITSGVFAKDPGTTEGTKHTLKATGCRIYTKYSDEASKNVSDDIVTYITNSTAYVVGEQEIVVKINASTFAAEFDHWEVKVNDVVTRVDASDTTYKASEDANGNYILTFTMPDGDVEVTPVVAKAEFHIGDNNLPEYKGKTYMGNLDLDGWRLTPATSGEYPYTLTVKQGTTIDLDNHTVAWRINTYGTVKNGITPGNVVNMKNEDGTYGRVENIAFKMNVNFGDQNPNITWVTLKNATACEVFPDIVGVIGKQTITIKPTVSADLFKGWVVVGDISDELAAQIEKQKDSDTLVLELDGEKKDRIAVAAKTESDTFRVNMLDGKATVEGQTVTAALPDQTVTITMDDSEIPEGMSFDHWVISPDVELEGGFKATDRTTSFTMPAQELTIYASLRTDSDDGVDAMTVVAGVAVGAGAAVLTYHIGTELYAKQVLGDGVAVPKTREDVALKAWELAGKPAVAIDGEPLSEVAQAEKWAVESGLMQNVDGSFNGQKKMNKLKALRVLDSAKKMNAQ